MAKSIKLSPKHGVNASLDLCFWCGEPKGLALCGHIHAKKGDHTDLEAPKGMVTGLEPCDACKAKFQQGVHMIEVSDDGSRFGENAAFALKDTEGHLHWPTGRWAVVPADALKNGQVGTRGLCSKETMDMIYAKTAQAQKKARK